MKKWIKLVLMFAAGFVSGLFIRLSVEIIDLRPHSPGGEALFPLLIALLMVAGYFIGRETKVHPAKRFESPPGLHRQCKQRGLRYPAQQK